MTSTLEIPTSQTASLNPSVHRNTLEVLTEVLNKSLTSSQPSNNIDSFNDIDNFKKLAESSASARRPHPHNVAGVSVLQRKIAKKPPLAYKKPLPGIVTTREIEALRWVSEQGTMSSDQLWRAIWWDELIKHSRYALFRIQFLKENGFLHTLKTPLSTKKYLLITKLGYELAAKSNSKNIPFSGHVALSQIPHIEGLTEIRIAIKKSGKLKDWQSDRSLLIDPYFPKERFNTYIPDAIWTSNTGKKFFIEYERTRKSLSRLRKKIEFYVRELERKDRLADFVLWVTEEPLYETLKHEITPYPNQRLRTLKEFIEETNSWSTK